MPSLYLGYVMHKPVWSGFLSTDLINRIQSTGMLKRLFGFPYTSSLISFQDLINSCSVDLFHCMKISNYCLHHNLCYLVMNHVNIRYVLVGITIFLPTCTNSLHRQSFITRTLHLFENLLYQKSNQIHV